MMKSALIFLILMFAQFLSAQSRLLCELRMHPSEDLEQYVGSLPDILSKNYLEKLVSSIGLTMNFDIKNCHSMWCNHASASLVNVKNDKWTRILLYNGESLESILTDTTRLSQSILLTHEIGHQLGGHNMVMMRERHQAFREFCDINSQRYDKEQCEEKFSKPDTGDHRLFKFFELEADRYSGYLLAMLGYRIVDIESAFIESSQDSIQFTKFHPSDAERFDAIKQGHGFALQDIEYNGNLNVHKLNMPKAYDGALRIAKKDSVMAGANTCRELIVDHSQYLAAESVGIELLDLKIEGHCLMLKLRLPYGCPDTEIKLVDSGRVAESMPPQRHIKLMVSGQGECDQSVTKDYYFDFSGLSRMQENGLVVFRLRNVSMSRPTKLRLRNQYTSEGARFGIEF